MKMRSLSANMYRQDLVAAARRTFCYRSAFIARKNPTVAECAVSTPCYITVPNIVSYLLLVLIGKLYTDTVTHLSNVSNGRQRGSVSPVVCCNIVSV
jgi:hypothetical protein